MIHSHRYAARSRSDRAVILGIVFLMVASVGGGALLASRDARAQAHNPPKAQPDGYDYQWTENPFAGDAEEIADGQRLYKNTCYICHLDNGGRGPDLKKSKLVDTAFIRIVREGRKGTQMPAWREKLTEEEMWKIYAFIRSTADQAK
jgi:mono/diheme cytochrome c family protein